MWHVEYNHQGLKHTAQVKKQCFLMAILYIRVVSVHIWSYCEILMEMKLIKAFSHRTLPHDTLVYLLGFFPFVTFLRIECSFDICSREDKLVSLLASSTLRCISSLHLSSPRDFRYQPTALGHATLSKKDQSLRALKAFCFQISWKSKKCGFVWEKIKRWLVFIGKAIGVCEFSPHVQLWGNKSHWDLGQCSLVSSSVNVLSSMTAFEFCRISSFWNGKGSSLCCLLWISCFASLECFFKGKVTNVWNSYSCQRGEWSCVLNKGVQKITSCWLSFPACFSVNVWTSTSHTFSQLTASVLGGV